MQRFAKLLLALCVLAAAAAALVSPASAQTGATLEGEILYNAQTTDLSVSAVCDPSGTSTITVHSTGNAVGPYFGTFEETAVVTFGPQSEGHAELQDVQATFTITAYDGTTITGTKELIVPAEGFHSGICTTTATGSGCTETFVDIRAHGEALRYEATIEGADGASSDRGRASLEVSAIVTECDGVVRTDGNFAEEFLVSVPVESPPASVVLSPAGAINPVDSFHTVSATVTDSAGQGVGGVTVRFGVTGVSSASGTCVTDGNGWCEYSYQVATFPGEDVITAYADTNDNGMQDEGEPSGVATKTVVLPSSTLGHATGGGKALRNQVAGTTETISFGFTAKATADDLKGSCSAVDPIAGVGINCLDVLAYRQFGNEATFYGTAEQNGGRTLYRITVIDNGERGTQDLFWIQTALGYSAGGPVVEGNVQVRAT
jgi:hypothetical protein